MASNNLASSKPSETAAQCRILDAALYQMTSQWTVKQEQMAGKREQLLHLLKEVGPARFAKAIQGVIQGYDGEYCPTIGIVRRYVPQVTDEQHGRSWRRDPNCPQCHGTGFYYVSDPESDRLYGRQHLAVQRCLEPGCLTRAETK